VRVSRGGGGRELIRQRKEKHVLLNLEEIIGKP